MASLGKFMRDDYDEPIDPMIHCHVDLSDEKLTGSGAHLVEAKFVGLTAELLTSKIRNFSIIAHIDHGKSTLADRLLELTNLKGSNKSLERVLDSLLLEQEKVSRSLAACEGVILLVDATKGIQAQTLAYYEIAKNLNLKVLPVINKMDLPSAQLSMVKNQLVELLDCQASDICLISAKTGQNVDLLLEKIVTDIPPPLEK
ncbi:16359_t:CDS:2 [Entrophospora sp. SA101]|nr:16359_t:CDS:2 [Entrophospora sp. SA101]